MKGVVMTTDEHTTTNDGLDDTDVSLEGRMAEDTFADDDSDYDGLGTTGVLDRDALNRRLNEVEDSVESGEVTVVPDDVPAQAGDDEDEAEPTEDELDAEETESAPEDDTTTTDPDATVLYSIAHSTPQIDGTPQESQIPSLRSGLLTLPSIDDVPEVDADSFESTYDEDYDYSDNGEDYAEEDAYDEQFDTPGIDVPEEKPKLFAKGTKSRRALKVIGIVSGSLLVVYGIGGLFFTSHFMPNTRVNGEDVSLMSVDDLATHVTELGAAYQDHIVGDGLDITIAAPDINLKYDGTAYGLEASTQIDPWKWPVKIFGSHDLYASTGITFDEAKLEAIVGAAVDGINTGAQPPTNATMSFDESQQAFVPVPDMLGTMVDRSNTIDAAAESIRTLQSELNLGDAELKQPTVRVDDERLAAVIERANRLLQTNIPMRIAGRDAGSIDVNLMKHWFTTNENCDLVVNVDNVKEWAQGDLSRQFDTVGTERKYTRPDGKQVTVTGGDYGWNLDGEALANLIAANLQSDNTAPIDVPMKATAVEWNPGGADWGKRYIDVDMTEQYVRVYDENSQIVLETPCVTGIPYHATDEGVYSIFEHTPNMTLVGLDYNGDGQPDYETPVSYWMPFNGGQGLHDAYWRYGFGGDIWQYDGSHGCVNLPSDAAAQLFDWSHVGDIVVVHW